MLAFNELSSASEHPPFAARARGSLAAWGHGEQDRHLLRRGRCQRGSAAAAPQTATEQNQTCSNDGREANPVEKKSMLKMWDEKKKEAQHCTCQVAYFWKQIRIRTKICKRKNFLFVSTQLFSARFLCINTCRKPAFHEPHHVHFRFLTVFLKLSAVPAGFLPMQAVQQDASCPGPELWPPLATRHQAPVPSHHGKIPACAGSACPRQAPRDSPAQEPPVLEPENGQSRLCLHLFNISPVVANFHETSHDTADVNHGNQVWQLTRWY